MCCYLYFPSHHPASVFEKYMVLQPLIAICGTTGVGKSKLAVELALAVGGKVINADAMQAYRGLDILTNKLRADEQRGVEHVLMNFKNPGEQYVVGEWVRDANREVSLTHLKTSCSRSSRVDSQHLVGGKGPYRCRRYILLDSSSPLP